MLLRSGHAQQAKVEFALAMRSAPSLVLVQLVKEIAATYPAPAEAVGALTYDLAWHHSSRRSCAINTSTSSSSPTPCDSRC